MKPHFGKINYPLLLPLLLLAIFLFSPEVTGQSSANDGAWNESNSWSNQQIPGPSDAVSIDHSITIPSGSEVTEVGSLSIDGILNIEGKLIVNGRVSIGNNGQFHMGDSAVVIINGNFDAKNKVKVSVSSYLIVKGSFKKNGASDKGELEVEEGHIYIFGDVDNWTDFSNCGGEYDGTTAEESNENCDYGTEVDYEENHDQLPDELIDLVNCFNLSAIADVTTCVGSAAEFSVAEEEGVIYQWQKRIPGGIWEAVAVSDDSPHIFSIPAVTADMNGTEYRVIVPAKGNCEKSISRKVVLTVKDFEVGIISGDTEVCPSSEVFYSIGEVPDAISYTWSLPGDWILESGQNTNSIKVIAGSSSGQVSVKLTNSCGRVETSSKAVTAKVLGLWTGNSSEDWNTAANWSCNTLPSSTTDVFIPAGLANYPLLQEGHSGATKNLKIEAGASVRVQGSLSVSVSIDNSGSLQVPGTIIFNGNTAQSLAANTFEGNRVGNLVVDNQNRLDLMGPLSLSETLEARNGDLISNGHLTLLSDASGTALIKGLGTGEVRGAVLIQRYLDPAFGYKYFSSTFKDLQVGDFSNYIDLNSAFPNFYQYKEDKNLEIKDSSIPMDASGWEKYTEAGNPLNIMEGYAVNFGGIKRVITLEFSGEVNNGAYLRELKNTHGEYTKGFHLVGNPYPSPIDWDATVGWTKENIDGAIHFFTASEDSQYTGTYRSYAAGVTSDGAKNTASNIIPSMQGFFVHVTDFVDIPVTIGTLGMTNEVRVVDFAQEFYKTSLKKTSPKTLIRLSAQYKDQHLQDPTVIYFDQGSKSNFDSRTDALKIMNTDVKVPNLYSLSSENKQLSINALPTVYSGEMRISLGLQVETSGEIILKLQDLEKFAAGTNVYLIDLKKRIARKLKEGFQYEFHTDKGIHNDRFELLFTEEQLIDEAVAFHDFFSVSNSDGKLWVNLNLAETQKGRIYLHSFSGQQLEVREGSFKEKIEFKNQRNSGIHIISLVLDGKRFTKKVIFNN